MDEVPIRASDAEREAAVTRLRDATGEGRLTLEELADRVESADTATTRADLDLLVADLPATATPSAVPVPAGPAESHLTVLSSLRRRGRFALARRSRFTTVLGSIDLDLREAVLAAPESEIELCTILGSARVLVPEGVAVAVRDGVMLGSTELHITAGAPPAAPVLRIHHTGALGSMEIRSKTRAEKLRGALTRSRT